MKVVKRYDAVHLRYEESNIRYGEGCEVEVVAGYDYDALIAERDELLSALKAMREEFRGHDLPYGSKAYCAATTAINKSEYPQ